MDSAILEGIKAYLRSGDKQIILEFTDEKDKNGKGSRIDRENNSENEND